jgi:hypothetical protein
MQHAIHINSSTMHRLFARTVGKRGNGLAVGAEGLRAPRADFGNMPSQQVQLVVAVRGTLAEPQYTVMKQSGIDKFRYLLGKVVLTLFPQLMCFDANCISK